MSAYYSVAVIKPPLLQLVPECAVPSIRLVRERHQSLGNPFLLGICLRCRRPIAIAKWNKRIGFLELAVLLAGCGEGTHEISHCWIFDTIPEKHDVLVSEHLADEAARPPLPEVCRAEVCCRQNQPPVVGCLVQLSVEIHQPTEGLRRSEEHTSELQSLMRISYAVFCLKNKTKTTK